MMYLRVMIYVTFQRVSQVLMMDGNNLKRMMDKKSQENMDLRKADTTKWALARQMPPSPQFSEDEEEEGAVGTSWKYSKEEQQARAEWFERKQKQAEDRAMFMAKTLAYWGRMKIKYPENPWYSSDYSDLSLMVTDIEEGRACYEEMLMPESVCKEEEEAKARAQKEKPVVQYAKFRTKKKKECRGCDCHRKRKEERKRERRSSSSSSGSSGSSNTDTSG